MSNIEYCRQACVSHIYTPETFQLAILLDCDFCRVVQNFPYVRLVRGDSGSGKRFNSKSRDAQFE